MACLIILFVALIFLNYFRDKSKNGQWYFLLIFYYFIVEVTIFIFFIYQIYKAENFFLVGNQEGLDAISKFRLSYATYFVSGRRDFFYKVDDELGYTVGRDKDIGKYVSNVQSIRSVQNFSLSPAPDKLRLAVFGDSFVFCDDEKNEDTWPHILQSETKGLEVLNFGVSGYGLSQSFLRYLKDGLRFQPDIILFNYISYGSRDDINPKDFWEFNNLRWASFYRVHFWLENEKLLSKSITPFDLFDIQFRKQYLYQPLGIDLDSWFWSSKIISSSNVGLMIKQLVIHSKAKQVQNQDFAGDSKLNAKIVHHLLDTAKHNRSKVIFFVPEDYSDLPAIVQNILNNFSGTVFIVSNSEFFRALKEKGIDPQSILNRSNHYNRKGNKIYAETILKILKSKTWGGGR